jgi:23S rRNA (adenine2503-C2)-methyltransferase
MSNDLKEKTLSELERIVVELCQPFDFTQGGERAKRVEPKKYLARYIFHFIHVEHVAAISEVTTLSKALRKQLADCGYYISQLHIVDTLTDPDGTIKYLFELADGNRIETVLLFDLPREMNLNRQSHRASVGSNISRGKGRRTLCISTQVGCAMNCGFCATGKVKLRRNLTAGEIVDQVNTVERLKGCDARLVERQTLNATDTSRANDRRKTRITNVVYMGMGEPLLNYDNVVKSVRILNHPEGKNIGIRHLTLSTCGIVPAIRKLANEDIHPRLAVSLNAPSDALRTQLMPINAKYPIAELLRAVRFYQAKTQQRVTFEYVMIKGLNDADAHAQMLAKLLHGIKCHVNLIEHNPHPGCKFVASDGERIERFAAILDNAGIETTLRFRMGRSINAACGQLGARWLDL